MNKLGRIDKFHFNVLSVEFEVAVKCLGTISYYHLGIQVQHPGD